jgi:hypothetical protein
VPAAEADDGYFFACAAERSVRHFRIPHVSHMWK